MKKTIFILMLAGLIAGLLTMGAAQAAVPQPSTITLGDSGWSWPAGTWDPATKTAVLTKDLKATIRIVGDGITLDGNRYKIVGNDAGDGVYLLGRTGVTVKNLKIKRFTNGIHVRLGGGNTITGITAKNNNCGIWIINSKNNTVADNLADNNSYRGILIQGAADNSLTGNSACNNIFGVWLMGSAGNTVAKNNASNNGCGFWLMGSANNTLADNTANANNVFGVHLQGSSGNTLTGNTVTDNVGGIRAMGSKNNAFTNNTVVNSGTGIYLQGCAGHVLSRNTLERNKYYGLNFLSAGGGTVSGNTVSANGCGLYFWNCSNNQVFNNNFIGNTSQARVGTGSGNVFNLPKPVGGNYWSDWTSPDADGDGFVDNPYVFDRTNRLFYGKDNLPWTRENGWLAAASAAAPVTTLELSGVLGKNGWYVSDVQVTLTAEGSGPVTTEYSFNGTDWTVYAGQFTLTEEGNTTLYYRSANEGSVEDTREQAVKIDKTTPEVTISTPVDGSEFLLNQNVTVDWSASDEVSGVASATGTLTSGEALGTGSAGANVFCVTAEDNAGNVGTITNNYYVRYVFSGFLPPIDNDGGSAFKLGSTVPVKFQLVDADQNPVAGANARLYLSKLTDGVIGEEIDAVSNGKAGDKLFRYAVEEEQYIFNLVTKDLTEGTWRLRAVLGDETSRYVNIFLRDK